MYNCIEVLITIATVTPEITSNKNFHCLESQREFCHVREPPLLSVTHNCVYVQLYIQTVCTCTILSKIEAALVTT